MKKRIIIITILGSIISILIYFYTEKNDINFVSLGDGLSLGMTPYTIEGYSYNDYLKEYLISTHKLNKYYDYSGSGKTVKELTYEIKENITITNQSISLQQAINEADILTIAIGMDELSEDKITSKIISDYKKDIKELLDLIKTLNNKQVIILGLYSIKPEEQLNIAKLNAIIRDISLSNDFLYIDISPLLNNKEYYLVPNNYYINYLGHKEISETIKKELQ